MDACSATEEQILEEISVLERKVRAVDDVKSGSGLRLRYCRMMLAALRDGHPERWVEYDA